MVHSSALPPSMLRRSPRHVSASHRWQVARLPWRGHMIVCGRWIAAVVNDLVVCCPVSRLSVLVHVHAITSSSVRAAGHDPRARRMRDPFRAGEALVSAPKRARWRKYRC